MQVIKLLLEALKNHRFLFNRLFVDVPASLEFFGQPLDPLLDHDQIGQQKFAVERVHVTCRVDGHVGGGNGIILEDTHDVDKAVHLLKLVTQFAADAVRADTFFQPADVGVGDRRVDGFLGVVHLAENINTRIGHRDNRRKDFHFAAAYGGSRAIAARQRVEDGGLATIG